MLKNIPGFENPDTIALIALGLILAWCFIFSASYAAFRVAQRPRRHSRRSANSRSRANSQTGSRSRRRAQRRDERRLEKLRREFSVDESSLESLDSEPIRPAPGPRDW